MGRSKLKCVKGLFSGRHFDREVILLCVRWYLRYKLSAWSEDGRSKAQNERVQQPHPKPHASSCAHSCEELTSIPIRVVTIKSSGQN
jgi:hypothetical protein